MRLHVCVRGSKAGAAGGSRKSVRDGVRGCVCHKCLCQLLQLLCCDLLLLAIVIHCCLPELLLHHHPPNSPAAQGG